MSTGHGEERLALAFRDPRACGAMRPVTCVQDAVSGARVETDSDAGSSGRPATTIRVP
jgi:hypothetical protein